MTAPKLTEAQRRDLLRRIDAIHLRLDDHDRRPGRWLVTCGKPSTHFGHMGLICVLEAGHDGDHSAVPPTSIIFKKQPGARIEKLDDETLEMLIEAVLNLTCKYPLADVVDAIAFHARATGEGADNDKQGAAWRTAANALDEAMMLVARAEAGL